MPINEYGAHPVLDTVFGERSRDVSAIKQLEQGKLPGRYRNMGAYVRAVPSSSTNILDGDHEGDILYDSSYLYVCLTLSEVLTWCRISLASSW